MFRVRRRGVNLGLSLGIGSAFVATWGLGQLAQIGETFLVSCLVSILVTFATLVQPQLLSSLH